MKIHLVFNSGRLNLVKEQNTQPDPASNNQTTIPLATIEFHTSYAEAIFLAHLADTYHQIDTISDRVDKAIEMAVNATYKKSV